ncbi:hypothetical protein D3C73_1448170 [compost metagenome]
MRCEQLRSVDGIEAGRGQFAWRGVDQLKVAYRGADADNAAQRGAIELISPAIDFCGLRSLMIARGGARSQRDGERV